MTSNMSLTLFITVHVSKRTLQGEGHSPTGWGIGGSVQLQTAGPM